MILPAGAQEFTVNHRSGYKSRERPNEAKVVSFLLV